MLLLITFAVPLVAIASALSASKMLPQRAVPFLPTVAPFLYLFYVLIAPLLYVSITERGIASVPPSILSSKNVSVSVIFLASYLLGTICRRLFVRLKRSPAMSRGDLTQAEEDPVYRATHVVLVAVGRFVLLIALLAKIIEVATLGPVSQRLYGEGQLEYSALTALSVIGEGLVLPGCLLVMYSTTRLWRRPLRAVDVLIVGGLFLVSGLFLGSRGELIGPTVLYVLFYMQSVRRIPVLRLVVGISSALALFVSIVYLRSADSPSYPLAETVLWQTISPVQLSANVAALVPSSVDHYGGSTYIAAFRQILPGPISRALGPVVGTGSLAYRELIGYTNPNHSWGFAYSTEAYLNFGMIGVSAAGFILGLAFSWAFRLFILAHRRSVRISVYMFPLLLAYLPYGFRSDSLGQLKTLLYGSIIIYLAILYSRSWSNRLALRRTKLKSPAYVGQYGFQRLKEEQSES